MFPFNKLIYPLEMYVLLIYMIAAKTLYLVWIDQIIQCKYHIPFLLNDHQISSIFTNHLDFFQSTLNETPSNVNQSHFHQHHSIVNNINVILVISIEHSNSILILLYLQHLQLITLQCHQIFIIDNHQHIHFISVIQHQSSSKI